MNKDTKYFWLGVASSIVASFIVIGLVEFVKYQNQEKKST